MASWCIHSVRTLNVHLTARDYTTYLATVLGDFFSLLFPFFFFFINICSRKINVKKKKTSKQHVIYRIVSIILFHVTDLFIPQKYSSVETD